MKTSSLTDAQQKLLKVLAKNNEEGYSYRDLAEAVGVRSTNTISYHLKQLEKKGFLKRNPGSPRDYLVLGAPESNISYINLYGAAHCGAKGSIFDESPTDRIPVASGLIPFSASKAFLVKAKGHSMEPRIHEGDLVLAKRQSEADDGDFVVCINKQEVLIKKLKRNGATILVSTNQEFDPILAASDFRIAGVVKTIISNVIS